MSDQPMKEMELEKRGRVEPPQSLAKPPRPNSKPEPKSSFRRAMDAVRLVMPIMQKVLPLMEGNIPLVIANLLAPQPAPPVDLEPLENSVTRMRAEHQELRVQIAGQAATLKHIGDQLEEAREATERIGTEQKEVTEDLHSLRSKVGVIAWVGLGLLVVSIGLNVALFLRVERILH